MNIRERYEALEHEVLAPEASFSSKTKGRLVKEEADPVRTEFQRDRDRIIHSKAFRRLSHKTQVFIAPEKTTTEPGLLTPSKWHRFRERLLERFA